MIFARMLKASSTTLTKIYNHSYNQQLQNQTLSRELFKVYLEQDAIYLKELANTLKIIAPRLIDTNHREFITKLSDETIHYENIMLSTYLGRPTTFYAPVATKTQVITDYTNHLLNTANNQPVEVALASLLPCFWIYSELGRQMYKTGISEQHPYRLWILSYADPEFFKTAETLMTMTETLAASSPQAEAMIAAFIKSANFELAFYEQTCPHQEPELQNTLTLTI